MICLVLTIFQLQMEGSQANTMATSKAVHIFTSILLQTKSHLVFGLTRTLVTKSVSNIVGVDSDFDKERQKNLEHELSLWVDGITEETRPTFCKLLDLAQKLTVQHETLVTHSWLSFFPTKDIENPNTSPLLSLALIGIGSDITSLPEPFVILTLKIVTKMLIFSKSAESLSCLFSKVFSSYSPTEMSPKGALHKIICYLKNYAEAIRHGGKGKYIAAKKTLCALFGEDHHHTETVSLLLTAKTQCEENAVSIIDNNKSHIDELEQSFQLLTRLNRDVMSTEHLESKVTLLLIVALQVRC